MIDSSFETLLSKIKTSWPHMAQNYLGLQLIGVGIATDARDFYFACSSRKTRLITSCSTHSLSGSRARNGRGAQAVARAITPPFHN